MRRARPLLIAVALGVAVACTEQLESGIACPTLCPQQTSGMKDTTFEAVEFDSTLSGFPPTGAEGRLLLADRPGLLDARVIVRFDTIRDQFRHAGTFDDSAIVAIDSVIVRMRIAESDTLGPDVTVEAYDVEIDTAGVGPSDDTASANLIPLFNTGRLIGSRTFTGAQLKDSISVPIDPAVLLAKFQQSYHRRLRVGIRIASSQPTQLTIFSGNGGYPPVLFVRPSGDSTVEMNFNFAHSSDPPTERAIASELADFQLIAAGPPPPAAGVLRVGGLPAYRSYLRFAVPPAILDSSAVVRATLILTQRPDQSSPATDSEYVAPFELTAGAAITDLKRILLFLQSPLDSLSITPLDSAERRFEVIDAVRRWRGTSDLRTPRALALRAETEGRAAWHAEFFGRGAPASVRPRLRLTYIPQTKSGLP